MNFGGLLSMLQNRFMGGGLPSLPQSQGQYMLNQGDMGEALNPLLAAQPGNRMVGGDLYTLQNRGYNPVADAVRQQQQSGVRTFPANAPSPFMGYQTFGQPNYTGLLAQMRANKATGQPSTAVPDTYQQVMGGVMKPVGQPAPTGPQTTQDKINAFFQQTYPASRYGGGYAQEVSNQYGPLINWLGSVLRK